MKIGVFKTSNKENEKRVPLYPEHLLNLSDKVKSFLYFEKGYGEKFGYADDELGIPVERFIERDQLFDDCDILILPKATKDDLKMMHEGQVLWGWVHCVQQKEIAQIAIDKKITLVAWESMFQWQNNEKSTHIFYKNNEIAGYAAVLHSLELLGIDGHFGPRRKVCIIGYGAVSRGAIYAFQGRGFNFLQVFSKRPIHLIGFQNPDVYYFNLSLIGNEYCCTAPVGKPKNFSEELFDSDIIVNGILQDTNNPMLFIRNKDIKLMKRNTLIIDISCDEGMGFEFAVPTTFDNPIIHLENGLIYYSVDHTPSYLWNAASREVSKTLIPYLIQLIELNFNFQKEITLQRAIEIQDGKILNKNIILFQKRSDNYPYEYLE